MTEWLAIWLTDWWSPDWLSVWLFAAWPTDCLIVWLSDWLTDWQTDWLTDLLRRDRTSSLIYYPFDSMIDWLTDFLNIQLNDSLTFYLTEVSVCLMDWPSDWLSTLLGSSRKAPPERSVPLTIRPENWLANWLIEYPTEWLIDFLSNQVSVCLFDGWTVWLTVNIAWFVTQSLSGKKRSTWH